MYNSKMIGLGIRKFTTRTFTYHTLLLFFSVSSVASVLAAETERMIDYNASVQAAEINREDTYQAYIAYFEKVYDVMDKNYYKQIRREDFNRFIQTFDRKIYKELTQTGKSSDFVRWRSAAFLIDYLKQQEDIFSAFYPPKPAKKYEKEVLGKRIDLGIVGKKIAMGYQVTFVEPRSDAFEKGLRGNDLVVEIDGESVSRLDEAQIDELLQPFENTLVDVTFLDGRTKQRQSISVLSQEYFKQTVFNIPLPVEHIYCLQIKRFNRKTAEDMFRYLKFMRQSGPINGLIIDLRGNPGGPPLAAREISSFFLKPGDAFAYFQKKNQPKAELDVPTIPEEYHFRGPMVILIDEDSGSASELFSGILQRRKRAVLMGENSAGQVFLKSMFHLDDESMLLLVTARGHHPDGHVFSFSGLIPDRYIREDEESDILKYAASYLVYMNNNSKE